MSEDEKRILNALLAGGYTPYSAADYIRTHDLADLRHTGKLSVQLNPADGPRYVRCRVRKTYWNGKWSCVVLHGNRAVECQHFPTWADAYQYAQEKAG